MVPVALAHNYTSLLPVTRQQPEPTMEAMATSVELADFPRSHSLSTFLSPAAWMIGYASPAVLTLGGRQLDSIHLVLLALNEECRAIKQGAFYHLPLRGEGDKGHPTDLIYLPDNWNDHDLNSWDQSSWAERLKMRTMGKYILHEQACRSN